MAAVNRFDNSQFNPLEIRAHAKQYDVERFKSKIKNFIEDEYRKFKRDF